MIALQTNYFALFLKLSPKRNYKELQHLYADEGRVIKTFFFLFFMVIDLAAVETRAKST